MGGIYLLNLGRCLNEGERMNTLNNVEGTQLLNVMDTESHEGFDSSYSYGFPIIVNTSAKGLYKPKKGNEQYYCYILNLGIAPHLGKTKVEAREKMRSFLHKMVRNHLKDKTKLPWMTWYPTDNMENLYILGGKQKNDAEWTKLDDKAKEREKLEVVEESLEELEYKSTRKRKEFLKELPVRVLEQLNKNLNKRKGPPLLKNSFWYVKQLLPLTYRSHYSDVSGDKHFAVWKMWFGKVYQYEDVVIND